MKSRFYMLYNLLLDHEAPPIPNIPVCIEIYRALARSLFIATESGVINNMYLNGYFINQ